MLLRKKRSLVAYKPESDVTLWVSEAVDWKPKAQVRAEIKSYNNSSPKLVIVESGVGYGEKPYTGQLLKRVELERVQTLIDLLLEGKKQLESLVKGGQEN